MYPTDAPYEFAQSPRKTVFTYAGGPSRATYADWEKDQFVFLRACSGSMLGDWATEIVDDLIEEVRRLEDYLRSQVSQGRDCYLRLRGVSLNEIGGGPTIYVELLYDYRDPPPAEPAEIQTALIDTQVGDGFPDLSVEVSLTSADYDSASFWPISDEYYRPVRKALGWD